MTNINTRPDFLIRVDGGHTFSNGMIYKLSSVDVGRHVCRGSNFVS